MTSAPLTLADAVAEHYDYIRRVAYRATKDLDNLDDYVQAAYVNCLTSIHRFDSSKGHTFKQYVAQASFYAIRTIRQKNRRERMKLADNAALGSIFAALPDRDLRKKIKLAWSQLTPNHRKILRLHFVGKLPSDQRMNLSRARKSLNHLLQTL